ncbi:LPXTG cell wall anchor domain-containing protein [Streptomyces albofaciens JCM 4342]|nr:LPXTG cell wall anchor domain-containing protein [Streptomyces albofaciens JCM 4342]
MTGEGAVRRRPADRGAATVNDSRTSASPLSPCPPATSYAPAGRVAAGRIRSAVTAGLLAAVALPVLSLTGTAYAEDSVPKAQAPSAAAPKAQAPSAAAPKEERDSARKPSPVPSHPSAAQPSAAQPSAVPGAASSAAPAPAPRDELAKTGASTTTNVALGAGAALLIAVGGGAVYASRRRRAN